MILLARNTLVPSRPLEVAVRRLAGLDDDTAAAAFVDTSAAAAAWGSVRAQMVTAQQDKCGWCESPLDERSIEVDHIRPKALRRYWWLALDLHNLLAACRSCNNFKGNQWPLVAGARRLRPREHPRDVQERALMLDPTFEEPGPHLTYDFFEGAWRIASTSERGRATIDVLELDRTRLTKKMNYHVKHVLDPLVRRLHVARAANDQAAFMDAGRHLAAYGRREHPWSALSQHVTAEAVSGAYRP